MENGDVQGWNLCHLKLNLYVAYWKNILELLSNPLPTQNSTLFEGFWPSNNWRLIICKVPFLPLLMLILKTHLSLHIVVLKTCNPLWKPLLTLCFETWALVISFWWGLQTRSCIMCGWERQRVRLWRMNKLKILDIFKFNGGCQWKKEQGMIENYIRIVGWANGNAIWYIQNNGLTSHLFYFHFLLKIMSPSITL